MKRTATLVAVFFSLLLPVAAQTAPSVAGTWALAYDVAQLSIKMTCTVTQADSKLAGTCTGDDKVAHDLTGEVNGQAVTFKFNKTFSGTQITDSFTAPQGMGTTGTMKGTMSVAPLDVSGTFTATKQ
jgi:hypothetical protein